MSGLAQHAQIFARIVFEHYGQMELAFIILLDGFDDRRLPGQSQVENVATRAGTQPDAIALLHFDA